ncbi:hypothetical protein C2845_PM04G21860 [Panicum miliaceum]|uniref:Uncharacterized protein n=1 Tax=Panicum miliaceum TaxID=4540 RepID=A0A3L6QTR2_PANMI|nr:hypothetical protein C2845_PM04G21860 [Panicum miliaceum]
MVLEDPSPSRRSPRERSSSRGRSTSCSPAEMQRRRLTGDEVAALAVRASSALVAAAQLSSPCCRRRTCPPRRPHRPGCWPARRGAGRRPAGVRAPTIAGDRGVLREKRVELEKQRARDER